MKLVNKYEFVEPGDAIELAPRDDVIELTLLMPGWQAAALETAAHSQGLTTAQMMRQLIRDFCNRPMQPRDRLSRDERW